MQVRPFSPTPAAPPVSSLAVGVHSDGRRARLALRGELDLATVPRLEHVVLDLCDQGVMDVTLDLSELAFFDSTALHLLLRLHAGLRGDCRGFGIVVGDAAAARVLALTRMRGRFRCDDADGG